MKVSTYLKTAVVTGAAVFVIGSAASAGPLGISLFDPDPQGANGTIATAALSERSPAGFTPEMNDYTGRGYPDTSAYYNPDSRLSLPPLATAVSEGKYYFHRRAPQVHTPHQGPFGTNR